MGVCIPGGVCYRGGSAPGGKSAWRVCSGGVSEKLPVWGVSAPGGGCLFRGGVCSRGVCACWDTTPPLWTGMTSTWYANNITLAHNFVAAVNKTLRLHIRFQWDGFHNNMFFKWLVRQSLNQVGTANKLTLPNCFPPWQNSISFLIDWFVTTKDCKYLRMK